MTHEIPVLRPLLPRAESLLPYLRQIDAARIYSNFGPLVMTFEERLARWLKLERNQVVSANSGLSALAGAILAAAGRAPAQRCCALMPAFTFVATAVAAEQCGYRPILADVDAGSWQLTPEAAFAHPELARVGLVIPVAAFGRPVDPAPWLDFQARTGIPVVIDGAACLDAIAQHCDRYLSSIPVAISFHATKGFATGEGGCVLSRSEPVIAGTGQALNYGFPGIRDCQSASTNGKMSEYAAAVGLAELDGWPEKYRAMHDVAARYRQRFTAAGLGGQLHTAPETGACYVLFACRNAAEAERVTAGMDSNLIQYRRWYGRGLHRQTYYANLPRVVLDTTDHLGQCLIGLPFAPDLSDDDLQRVVSAVQSGVLQGGATP